jgi:hypothetical protein
MGTWRVKPMAVKKKEDLLESFRQLITKEVLDWGKLWSNEFLLSQFISPSQRRPKRLIALQEIFSEINTKDQRTLLGRLKRYTLLIPPSLSSAIVFKADKLQILYLGAILERFPLDLVRYIVAHEFAHVLLDHTSKYYSRKERDTDRVVEVRWGFTKEVKARKRYEEKRALRILSQRERQNRERNKIGRDIKERDRNRRRGKQDRERREESQK